MNLERPEIVFLNWIDLNWLEIWIDLIWFELNWIELNWINHGYFTGGIDDEFDQILGEDEQFQAWYWDLDQYKYNIQTQQQYTW